MAESYLVPPSPTNRLLLALQSPFRDEIAWSLSRLIHASFFFPQHLILSEWCGLAERLLTFVDRLNKAARGQPYVDKDGPGRVAICSDDFFHQIENTDNVGEDTIYEETERQTCSFDPRSNDDDYIILNTAISASLILRNASDFEANAQWISKLRGVVRIAAEVTALPEEVYGFEGDQLRDGDPDSATATSTSNAPQALEPEEQMRLEGIRELRLYWVEIAQTLASRIRIYSRAPIVRFEDGSIRRVPADAVDVAAAAAAVAKAALEDDEEEEMAEAPIAPAGAHRLHSSDRLYAHMILLLHTTADRALLLAVMRFLANLIASSKTKPEIFVERKITASDSERLEGLSPGIIGRAKELIPLCDFDEQLAEVLLDCLDASVSTSVERPDPSNSVEALRAIDDTLQEQSPMRREWPNALKLVAANNRRFSTTTSLSTTHRALPLSQPVTTLLARLLSHKITSWPRQHLMTISPALQPLLRYIPSAQLHAREALIRDPIQADAALRWKRLREMKAESGLVEYTTSSEKQRLKELDEPARVQEWLKLVTRVNASPEANAYITQMQIWTSYRDTFEPYIKASQQKALQDGSKPLAGLMQAADVISTVTALLQGTSAVLRPEEDPRIGGQKFVIAGLEGNLRPEVRRYNCHWRGCPQPNVDSSEAQRDHIRAHVGHSKMSDQSLRCQWGSCRYQLPFEASDGASDDDRQAMMVAHVKTHLPTDYSVVSHLETKDAIQAAVSRPTLPPGHGRSVPLSSHAAANESSSPAKKNPHLHPDGTHALSAASPSKGTIDRPSQIPFHVYRTPFDPVRNEPYGPAYAATRILAALARMCHTILGDKTIGGDDEDENDDGRASRTGKRMKLDFSDRRDQEKFGMPFTLPPDFQATVAPTALPSVQPTPSEFATAEGQGASAAGSPDVLAMSATEVPPQQQGIDAKEEATVALHELMLVEDEMVKWAGCNDILTPTLMEALDHLSTVKGSRETGKERLLRRRLTPAASVRTG